MSLIRNTRLKSIATKKTKSSPQFRYELIPIGIQSYLLRFGFLGVFLGSKCISQEVFGCLGNKPSMYVIIFPLGT